MANVHRWGADDWIDRNGEVREGDEDGREGKGESKISAGRGGEGLQRHAMTF